ncbi:MAG: YbbR-like domain-containing protein [Bacteroidales bacterium]|nr:YbbR-like domain-containing protein [Bacteroidales bacterium]
MWLPREIKKFVSTLPTISRRDVLTFSVFLLVSAFFWLAQSAYEQSDSTFEVALHIENQPAGAVFTTHVPKSLKVTLYDNNIHLLAYGKNNRLQSLTVDFDRYADIAGNFRISGAELQSLLLNELSSTTQITAISPALIDARYALTEGKKVPVVLNADISTRGNFRDFEPILSTDSVLVHAPGYILDTLQFVQTELLSGSDLTDSVQTRVAIQLGMGVKVSPDSIDVTIPVIQYVEKIFPETDITASGVPSGKRLVLFPRKAQVRCLVNFTRYNRISADDIRLSVSFDSLRKHPELESLPVNLSTDLDETDVYGIRFEPKTVEFSIEE